MNEAFSFCSYCGAAFPQDAGWPRTCPACGRTTYRNPLPVCVVLVPVTRCDGQAGLLVVRRGIPPRVGMLALPGGYIHFDETWQEAGAREVFEETGVALDPGEIHEWAVRSAPDGTLIVYGLAEALREDSLPPFEPNHEATERLVLAAPPAEMAFALHAQMVERFFRA